MHKDQRVMSPLGPGTVSGFEDFINNGMTSMLLDEDPNNGFRVRVTLDDPSTWIGQEQYGDPYFFRSQLTELKD